MTQAQPPTVRLTDTTFRDGNESLLGASLRAEEILPLAARLDQVGFSAIEAFGGAMFAASLGLGDDPWAYLRRLRELVSHTPLQALVRGQSLLGQRHLADDAVELFLETAAGHGVDVFRVFDPLNDTRNLEVTVRAAVKVGRRVQVALCWSPEAAGEEAPELPRLARAMAELGAHELVVKDSSGALDATTAATLVAGIRAATGLPVVLHTHCAGGMGMLACAAAVEAGAEGLDTAVSALAWGDSLPAAESVAAALTAVGRDHGVDLGRLAEVRRDLWELRRRHQGSGCHDAATAGADALRWRLPATVVADLWDQLDRHRAGGRLEEAVAEVLRIQQELGGPPLVRPTSRMVAAQAVYHVLGGERYATVTQELKEYLQGLAGRAPRPADPEVRRIVLGQDEPITVRPADLLEPQVESQRAELRRRGLPAADEEVLTYLMLPEEAAGLYEARGKAAATAAHGRGASVESAGAPGGEAEPAEGAAQAGESVEVAPGAEAAEAAQVVQTSQFQVEVEGEVFTVRVTGMGGAVLPAGVTQAVAPAAAHAQPDVPRDGAVVAPMQGLIVKIPIAVGDEVKLGDVVVVLEAMKMQNDIVATRPGRVTGIYVKEGDVVKPSQALVAVG